MATLAGAAFAAVRKQLENDLASVDGETLRTMLADAAANATSVDRREAFRLAMATSVHRDCVREVAVEATFFIDGAAHLQAALSRVGLCFISVVRETRTASNVSFLW
jgi:hypothetical protein